MGTINVYSVKNALEAEGWQLISEVYKNLKTPLEMQCPAGHKQEQTFDQWRKHKICDACMAGDPYKVKKIKCRRKAQMYREYQRLTQRQASQVILYMMIKCQLALELLKRILVTKLPNVLIR